MRSAGFLARRSQETRHEHFRRAAAAAAALHRAPSPSSRKCSSWTSPAPRSTPIATARVEELIRELRTPYTIVTVTHNMQQASRVSDKTAFFYVGELIEFAETARLFDSPRERKTEDYITGRFG